MSDRAAFEKEFVPSYCHWDGTKYAPEDDYDPDSYQVAHRFNMAWKAWQAAQAQAVNQQLPDGYVLVPKSALDGALYLAGLAVTSTDFGSQYRSDFKACCEALLSAAQEVGK